MEPSQRIDGATVEDARALLLDCCGSQQWVTRMLNRRPFGSTPRLLEAARDEWLALSPGDWLEAFSHHPEIGDREALRARFPTTHQLSAREQAGVSGASEDVLEALAAANGKYRRRFGFIFIVCATGKTAEQMLVLLRARLDNDPSTELGVAAEEQAKITILRLEGLAASRRAK